MDTFGALTFVFEHLPYGPGVDDAKVRLLIHLALPHLVDLLRNLNPQTLAFIPNSTKSAEVAIVLKSLSPDA